MQVYPEQLELERGSEDDGNHYNSTITLPSSFGVEGAGGTKTASGGGGGHESPAGLLSLSQRYALYYVIEVLPLNPPQ